MTRRALWAALVGLAAVVVAIGPSHAQEVPPFSAPVVDAAGVVPDDVERRLNEELLAYQRRSGHQIAVAVVETTGGRSIEDYSIDLARQWGVGREGEDDGVVLVVAYGDREVRIEVGRGVEDELTDIESGRILRNHVIPRLRAGDPGDAVVVGTRAIRQTLGDAGADVPAPVEDEGGDGGPSWVNIGLIALAFFL
ncbi:MAG TPA: TPM domain-containing protein, partial [Acidimicrobiia bacterium]|nr:TPM domain-containing protein [Acidimicrobiia bacterium]